MRIGVIGGTKFVGRAFTEASLAGGHELVLFHRGQTGHDLFPEAKHISGDRNSREDLGRMAQEGPFDAVVDTCGYFPRQASLSAEVLSDAGLYAFISSISVYAPNGSRGPDEDSPVAHLEDPAIEEITGETYGGLKALCESEVAKAFGRRALIMRPGLIVGPWDPTDRFTYWPVRLSEGGPVLAPGDGDDPVQFIDVRDLAAWMRHMVERGVGGTFNAVGPRDRTTWRELLGDRSELRWAPAEWLAERGVEPWSDLPAWLPREGEAGGMAESSNVRAVAAGLEFRPFAETMADTLAWFRAERPAGPLKAGLSRERETELLAELG